MADVDLSPEGLAAIKARADAASEGPWHGDHDEYGCVTVGNYGWVVSGPNFPAYDEDTEQGRADAEFIAHSRTDVPALHAEVLRLRAELARYRSIGWATVHPGTERPINGLYMGHLHGAPPDWSDGEMVTFARQYFGADPVEVFVRGGDS